MTYFQFHLVFLFPPIVLLLWAVFRRTPAAARRKVAISMLSICAVSALYTTPWDNYLVYRGVWWYGVERVMATIAYVPVEEYLFFILQPILTGLLYLLFKHASTERTVHAQVAHRVVTIALIALSALGIWMVVGGSERALYMGLILGWASPILAGLWYYGGIYFMRTYRPIVLSIALSTLYLWVADWTAISLEIWTISPEFSFGIEPFGLPIEEAIFFLVTNVLVVFGLTLFLDGERIGQLRSSLTDVTLHAAPSST